MRLVSATGEFLELKVAGYQFPDAADPRQRYSWHIVRGEVRAGTGSWTFRYPALTCDESPRLADWLRLAARYDGRTIPARLTFTEPNLAFEVLERSGDRILVRVDLDLEFRPPWADTGTAAGHSTPLDLLLEPGDLLTAAADWDVDVDRFPDRTGQSTPAQLSPVSVAADPGELPYGLTWDDLRACLPDFDRPTDARRSHLKQGINKGTNSCILTLNYRTARTDRSRTLFFKQGMSGAEAAKHQFLAAHRVPTPALRHTVERPGSDVLVFEFLPVIGIEPAAANELIELIARLNAVEDPPIALFPPNPGTPEAQFDIGVRAALHRLADDPAATPFVRPEPWFRTYKSIGEVVATLPVALNHGELHFQQVGRSTPDSELVLFDLETTALLPRFTDIADILHSLSTYSGRSEHELFALYLHELHRRTGVALDDVAALSELRLLRAVRLFWSLPWRFAMADNAGMRDGPATAARILHRDLSELDLLA